MRRFFIPEDRIQGDDAYIDGSDALHISKVLRMSKGDTIEASDGTGNSLTAEIVDIAKDASNPKIFLKITDRKFLEERTLNLRVFQAIPRGNAMDLIVEKFVELGVGEIIPVITERTVPRYDKKKGAAKVERWNKIALETMKKVGRTSLPYIDKITPLDKIGGKIYNDSLKILPWELEPQKTLKDTLRQHTQHGKIELVIGPEGGFSQGEVIYLTDLGFVTVTLGKRILKTDTAGIVCVANIFYELDDD